MEIKPNEGVGPIQLGMPRKEVRKVMAKEGYKLENSHGRMDYFPLVNVEYTNDDLVTWIGVAFWPGCTLFDRDPFEMTQKQVLRFLRKHDTPDDDVSDKKHGFYLFPELILSLDEPRTQEESPSLCASVPNFFSVIGIGDERYLEAIRRIRAKGPFDVEWSKTRKRPVASSREGFKAYREMGAEVALDDDGEVRRVTFAWHTMSRDITDEDLKWLESMPKLTALFLGGRKQVTIKGIAHAANCRELEGLCIANTMLDDKVLRYLPNWCHLRDLSLPKGITARGLSKLKRMPELYKLDIELGKGTQEGIHHLSELSNLRVLDLDDVNSRAIPQLKKLTQLHSFSAYSLTPKSLERLRKALPHVDIYG